MSDIAENAALRLMLRNMAPIIKDTMIQAAARLEDNVYNLILVMAHRLGGDLENPLDNTVFIKSNTPGKARIELRNDPTKQKSESDNNTLAEIFPIAKHLIAEEAQAWKLSPFDVCLVLKLKKGEDTGTGFTAESIDLRMITRKGIEPRRTKTIA